MVRLVGFHYKNTVHLIEEDDVDGACCGCGGELKLFIYWKTSRPDHLRILDVDERKMLHCYLEKYSMRV